MGMDIYASVGYGFVIKEADGDRDPIYEILNELEDIGLELPSNDNYPLETYEVINMLYDSFKGVTTLSFGGDGYETIALVATDSVNSNGTWSAEPLTIPEISPKWAKDLQTACEKAGLQYKEPEWLFGAYYSH